MTRGSTAAGTTTTTALSKVGELLALAPRPALLREGVRADRVPVATPPPLPQRAALRDAAARALLGGLQASLEPRLESLEGGLRLLGPLRPRGEGRGGRDGPRRRRRRRRQQRRQRGRRLARGEAPAARAIAFGGLRAQQA